MLKIRLKRYGRRNRPFFRIEVFDVRVQRDGKSVEILGWYDPLVAEEDKKHTLDADRAKHWLSVGAQPSGTVSNIMAKHGVHQAATVKPATNARHAATPIRPFHGLRWLPIAPAHSLRGNPLGSTRGVYKNLMRLKRALVNR